MEEAPQHTIEKPTTIEGPGLFMSKPASVRFSPAPANHGVVFARTDVTEGTAVTRLMRPFSSSSPPIWTVSLSVARWVRRLL